VGYLGDLNYKLECVRTVQVMDGFMPIPYNLLQIKGTHTYSAPKVYQETQKFFVFVYG